MFVLLPPAALGLIGAGEGNVSFRLGAHVLATPTGVNKAELPPDGLVLTTLDGAPLVEGQRPSSELPMHLAVYRARPDVAAIVHAHPLTAIALTLAGISLEAPLLAEAVTALGGGVPTAPYATPSTEEMARTVATTLGARDACCMGWHGALAVGRTLDEACDRMETVERLAQIVLRARLLGADPAPLPPDEIARLLKLAGR
ncbi:MAG: class II aldolase/adducin family protein [Myxococcales bacterium]